MPHSNFDLVAPIYDRLAKLVFGNSLYQAQTTFLNNLPANSRVLIIGGGTGWIIKPVLLAGSQLTIVYLEASGKMLSLAQQSIAHHPFIDQVEFRLGTELNIRPDETFHVIISHFFLDLFTLPELKNTCTTLIKALKTNGYWYISDFVYPSCFGIKRVAAWLLFKSMYIFFRVTCQISAKKLPAWENLLSSYSLYPLKSCYFYGGLVKATVWQKPI